VKPAFFLHDFFTTALPTLASPFASLFGSFEFFFFRFEHASFAAQKN